MNSFLSRLCLVLFCLAGLGLCQRNVQAQVNLPLPALVLNTDDSGPGSLRQAILDANAQPGKTIKFNIPRISPYYDSIYGVFTFRFVSELPAITADGTVIDGTTQTAFSGNDNPNGPEIELNGWDYAIPNGLTINAANCVVKGLSIGNFRGNGILISGPTASGNAIRGCHIGRAASGGAANGNGIRIESASNIIGGTSVETRNIVTTNTGSGVLIIGTGARGNLVQGNYIGVDYNGDFSFGNHYGVQISAGATNNTVGGTVSAITTESPRNVISGNTNIGVLIQGVGTSNNRVQGNFIGTNRTGSLDVANYHGVQINQGATNNTIGGSDSRQRNLIAFNSGFGVAVGTGAAGSTTGNLIRGNEIYRNGQLGINLSGGNEANQYVTQNDSIDSDTGSNNLQNYPVLTRVSAEANYSFIKGSLNSTPSRTFLIEFFRSAAADSSGYGEGEVPLGTTTVATNANGYAEINYTVDSIYTGYFYTATATDTTTNDTSEFSQAVKSLPPGDRLIVTTTADVVGIDGETSLREAINYANQTPAADTIRFNIPTTDRGYRGAAFINLKSALPALAGNGAGTLIDGSTQTAFTGETNANGPEVVLDGTNPTGISFNGLTLSAPNCMVKNLVMYRFYHAIVITGQGANGNKVEGCYIGTSINGADNVSNSNGGIRIETSSNIIGGPRGEARNVISGNIGDGILLTNNASGNMVMGNYIGTNAAGTYPLANGVGIQIASGASNNTIGGPRVEARNVISGNRSSGVLIQGSNVRNNVVQGNYIGTNATGGNGSSFANMGNGSGMWGRGAVELDQATADNIIGGTGSGEGNRIAYNANDGVLVTSGGSSGVVLRNSIRGNEIFANGQLGINLQGGATNNYGVTINDAGDGDTGANALQNYPVITMVRIANGLTTISGTLNSTPHVTYALDFYRNPSADPSGFGEGEIYVGSTSVWTDTSGNVNFNFTFSGNFPGQYFTATATNTLTKDTSEFSKAVLPDILPPTVTITVPANGKFVNKLPEISGTAQENTGGSGLDRVLMRLWREQDGLHWNGTSWVGNEVDLGTLLFSSPATAVATWKRDSMLPSGANLPDGNYRATAIAYDKAGNQAGTVSNFTVDATPPTLTWGEATPAANANGWNNSAVTLPFTTADNLSGVVSSSFASPLRFSNAGANQTRTVTVTDGAGNAATFTSPTVNLDFAAPTTTANLTGSSGSADYYKGAVAVELTATDDRSGVETTYYRIDGGDVQTYTAPFTVSGDGPHTVMFWSVDKAGNEEQPHPSATFKIDSQAPTLSWGNATPAANADGWHNSTVSLPYTTSDNYSGVAAATPASALQFTTEGAGITKTVTVTDKAGSQAIFTSPGINLDLTAPVTRANVSGSNSNGYYSSSVMVDLTATDNLSEVAATYYSLDGGNPQRYTGPFLVPGQGQHTICYWSVDKADNEEADQCGNINIDGVAPSITVAATPSILKSQNKLVPVKISGKITDATSGVDPATATYSVTDEYGQVQPRGSLTLASDGSYSVQVQLSAKRNGSDRNGRLYTITVRATDRTGNQGSNTATVTVQ